MRATSGSASRGTAMSTTNSGRSGRASIASATLPGVRMKCEAPVDVTTTSLAFNPSDQPGGVRARDRYQVFRTTPCAF